MKEQQPSEWNSEQEEREHPPTIPSQKIPNPVNN